MWSAQEPGQSLTSTGQVNAGSIARPSASSRLRRLVWRPRPRAVVAPSAAQTDGELNGRLSQRRRPKQLAGLAGGTACSSAWAGEPHLREKMRIWACALRAAPHWFINRCRPTYIVRTSYAAVDLRRLRTRHSRTFSTSDREWRHQHGPEKRLSFFLARPCAS